CDHGRSSIEANFHQGLVRPIWHNRNAAKPGLRCKGAARIDDYHLVTDGASHRHDRLCDMHRPDDDESGRRTEHIDKNLAVVECYRAAFIATEGGLERLRVILPELVWRMHQPTVTVGKIGDKRCGPARFKIADDPT